MGECGSLVPIIINCLKAIGYFTWCLTLPPVLRPFGYNTIIERGLCGVVAQVSGTFQ